MPCSMLETGVTEQSGAASTRLRSDTFCPEDALKQKHVPSVTSWVNIAAVACTEERAGGESRWVKACFLEHTPERGSALEQHGRGTDQHSVVMEEWESCNTHTHTTFIQSDSERKRQKDSWKGREREWEIYENYKRWRWRGSYWKKICTEKEGEKQKGRERDGKKQRWRETKCGTEAKEKGVRWREKETEMQKNRWKRREWEKQKDKERKS